MANHKKALHHHGKAGDALKKGDLKGAAHHFGHAMAALRTTAGQAEEPDEMDTDELPEGESEGSAPPMAQSSIRSRLSRFKK